MTIPLWLGVVLSLCFLLDIITCCAGLVADVLENKSTRLRVVSLIGNLVIFIALVGLIARAI